MVNLSLKLTFNIAGACGTLYNPYTCPAFPAMSTLGSVATRAPFASGDVIPLAPAVAAAVVASSKVVPSYTDKRSVIQTPKLFLKTVYFRAKEAEHLKQLIVKGFSQELVYTVSTAYPSKHLSGLINHPICQGVIRPVRMWVLPLATDTLTRSDNSFPASIGPNYLRNTQIQLNGLPIYLNEFKSQYMYYKEFRTQCIGASSSQSCGMRTPVSYTDWSSEKMLQ